MRNFSLGFSLGILICAGLSFAEDPGQQFRDWQDTTNQFIYGGPKLDYDRNQLLREQNELLRYPC